MKLFLKKFQKRIVERKILRTKKFRALMILSACLGLLLLGLGAFHIIKDTQQTIETERAGLADQNEIDFEKIPHPPHLNQFVSFIQNTKNVRFIEKFQNSYFAATDAGLLMLDREGKLVKHFTVLDGLPESDLTSLAVYNSELYIGTRSKGLVVFDGKNFAGFRFIKHETQAITDLMADEQRLLIGTFAGGLIEFDGRKFREIKTETGKSIVGVNCLNRDEESLFVGTFDDGLWVLTGGNWQHLTTENGLLSNRVAGIETIGQRLFIGTDLGVSQVALSDLKQTGQKVFQNGFDLPTLSSLVKKNEQIFLTTDDGQFFTFDAKKQRLNSKTLNKISWDKPSDLKNARLILLEKEIWFVGTGGIWQISAENSTQLLPSSFGDPGDEQMPTSNIVSALAFDRDSRLWVGNFRRGIDIFSAEGRKIKHLEDETIREINFLRRQENSTIAATSKGAAVVDRGFNSKIISAQQDLPSNSITHISTGGTEKEPTEVFATGKGLWINEKGSARGFSTVNGLPGNSVSTTLYTDDAIYAGTLGGLARIEKGRVVRTYKGSNSPLQNNWVTALCASGARIFAGTYGGGVYEILPSGELRGFSEETGKLFVNPNAMFSDGEKLFVGTLRGVWVLDLNSQKWTHLKDFLPSEVVLSIGGNSENVFFGTTGGIARINRRFWL